MKKLITTIASIFAFTGIAQATQSLDYKCIDTTGPIIEQRMLNNTDFRVFEDYNSDGIADAQITYILDKGCLRKIRIVKPPVKETDIEANRKDTAAYKEYLESKN